MQPRNALKKISKKLLIPHLWPPAMLPFPISFLSVNLIVIPGLTFQWWQSPSPPPVLELRTGACMEGSPEDRVCLGDSGIARAVAASSMWGCGDLMVTPFSGPLLPDDDSQMMIPRWVITPALHRKSHCPPRRGQFCLFLCVEIECNYPNSGLQRPGSVWHQALLSEPRGRTRLLVCHGWRPAVEKAAASQERETIYSQWLRSLWTSFPYIYIHIFFSSYKFCWRGEKCQRGAPVEC